MQKKEIEYFLEKTLNSRETLVELGATTNINVAIVMDVLSENIEELAEVVQESLTLAPITSSKKKASQRAPQKFYSL